MEYKKTINLPKTSFPMKAGLTEKEPKMLKAWEKEGLYQQLRNARKGKEKFILHDGPPYANGDIHMGTALNKILKDIIVRFNALKGYDTPFVPGWDCHGLPIEHRVVKELGDKKESTSLDDLRNLCRKYARKYVDKQRKQFKRLGVIGDWDAPYLTMSREYEAAIVETFARLVEKGYVYKGLRPIHWCMDCGTALAEAEVEYADHTSHSIYVKFPVKNKVSDTLSENVYVMIWTTTPWTLPANVACAFNHAYDYVAVTIDGDRCIMAKGLMESTLQKLGHRFEEMEIVPVTHDEIAALVVQHPFIDRESKVVYADYVTLETGTGIVHTAPGHGQEDYHTGLKYDLDILSPVERDGTFSSEFPLMEGLSIWEGNKKIITLLEEKGLLYHTEEIEHSYPHCWRCKEPLIFRATEQWFLKIEHEGLREQTLSFMDTIEWHPKWGQQRMTNMLQNRPDWCLSRQRAWGVPIPAFYCRKCGETHLNEETVRHFSSIVKEKGVDVWFTADVKTLLPEGFTCGCGSTEFERENDILDVWFDSGVSSFAVLDTHPELSAPADVYIEGNDQYRGWFQASIWPSVALRGKPPYKTIITSGWMLDEEGKTMHKSAGNAVSPDEVTGRYGADILRLWVTSEDFKEDLRLGQNLLKVTADAYRKVRNTFRYILGNLDGFNPETDKVAPSEMKEVDRYALSLLHTFIAEVTEKFETYEFHRYYQRLMNYCASDLSNTYFDLLKDRLYCDGRTSQTRRSAQTVLYEIMMALVKVIAPVMPFTAEEVWKTYKGDDVPSVHIDYWPTTDEGVIDTALEAKWKKILAARDDVLKALEMARDAGVLKKSLEGEAVLFVADAELKKTLVDAGDDLKEVFIVSNVRFVDEKSEGYHDGAVLSVLIEHAEGPMCVRCWNYSETVGTHDAHPELCSRCFEAVSSL